MQLCGMSDILLSPHNKKRATKSQKNIITNESVQAFQQHLEKLSQVKGPIGDKQPLLVPFLSEAESKVISTVVETAEDKNNIFEELQQLSELNFLQLIGVVCVHLQSSIHTKIHHIMCSLLNIQLPGNFLLIF